MAVPWLRAWVGLMGAVLCACVSGGATPPEPGSSAGALVINELVSHNDGVAVDERGETDDYLELLNAGPTPIDLGTLVLQDAAGEARLPALVLQPGARVLLWADDDPEQGETHLPLKLSAAGEALSILDAHGRLVEQVSVPPLTLNETYARFPDGSGEFDRCRYASPGAPNGARCEPPAPEGLSPTERFASYTWPESAFAAPRDVRLSELSLRPADFVELENGGDTPRALADYQLWLSPHGPGLVWPGPGDGSEVTLPDVVLQPGERIRVALRDSDTTALEADPAFEGVASLFERTGALVERVDFMHWPAGASLARSSDRARHHFCAAPTPEAAVACEPLASRPIGDRLRHLRTPGDLLALSTGNTALGVRSAKAVYDMAAGGVVHLLRASDWPLHYTFVRERIEGLPHLDRCDPEQDREFVAGWVAFSQTEYFQSEGRRYLLMTLNEYPQADLSTVEFANGDAILASDMRTGFFAAVAHTPDPRVYSLRPQAGSQAERMRSIEGTVPIVSEEAPFEDVLFQPLTAGVTYGTLRFVPADGLATAALGPRTIVVTDDVPNDIPLVGGLITEAFQTPLAHVNVLSQSRGTPNMALRGARADARLAPLFDKLVRLEVAAGDFSLTLADPAEADAFFAARAGAGQPLLPRIDTGVRGLQRLADHAIESLPALGAKAAQLAELVQLHRASDNKLFAVPKAPAAIPVVHSLSHFDDSGATALLAELRADAAFRADPEVRAAGLARVRAAVMDHPVDPQLLSEVRAYVQAEFGDARVRFRSSSNTEDLPGFTGAGLYTSLSGALSDPERPIEDAIRTVWASLWNTRAYDEREFAGIDQTAVAMGVLIHPAFLSEHANGVAVSRNVQDPIDGDVYYLNAQIGEASVTNPAPGVTTDQILFELGGFAPGPRYQSRSNLIDAPVLSDAEIAQVAAALQRVHGHYQGRLAGAAADRWFAMEIEWKLIGDGRLLLIKQARPHNFGSAERPTDCREF